MKFSLNYILRAYLLKKQNSEYYTVISSRGQL